LETSYRRLVKICRKPRGPPAFLANASDVDFVPINPWRQKLLLLGPRTMRLSDEFMANVDAWAAAQEDKPGRSEAIRRLVEMGLKKGK
jgi:hypothetical protein